ncbi:hypothetical protein [Nonomuraea sp. NPDC001699]
MDGHADIQFKSGAKIPLDIVTQDSGFIQQRGEGAAVKLSDLLDWVAKNCGGHALPEDLLAQTIDQLDVIIEVTQKSTSYDFMAVQNAEMSELPLALRSVKIMYVTNPELFVLRATVYVKVETGGTGHKLEFIGQLQQSASGWQLEADWEADGGHGGISLTDLAKAFGVT